jgi:ATP-dependent protease ClpP protease subunit
MKFVISGELCGFGEFDTVLSECEGKKEKKLELHICSEGGDIFLSRAIMARILQSPLDIHAYGYGAVMSGAVLPFVVCKKRYLSRHAWMMIHDTQTIGDNETKNTTQISQEANFNIKFDDQDYRFLAEYTNKSYSYWKKRIKGKGDIYIHPEEALKLGLCDELF